MKFYIRLFFVLTPLVLAMLAFINDENVEALLWFILSTLISIEYTLRDMNDR